MYARDGYKFMIPLLHGLLSLDSSTINRLKGTGQMVLWLSRNVFHIQGQCDFDLHIIAQK